MLTPMSALALPFDQTFQARPSGAFGAFFAAIANVDRNVDERIAEATDFCAEGERMIDGYVGNLLGLPKFAEAAAEQGAKLDWDIVIERAELGEREAARDFENTLMLGRRLVKLVRLKDRRYANSVNQLVDRYAAAMSKFLEVLRDVRWQLMALRATYAPSDGSATFSDQAALRKYLDSASA
jgi:hypothetical protein